MNRNELIKALQSGYITYRKRNIPIVWTGQNAQHIAEEHVKNPKTHPFFHIIIQQMAKRVKKWEKAKRSKNRISGLVLNKKTNQRFLIIVEIHSKFAHIITCYRR